MSAMRRRILLVDDDKDFLEGTKIILEKNNFEVATAVSGEVVQVNEKLSEDPSSVNKDPYGEGWLVKIKIVDPSELDSLLTSTEYEDLIQKESDQ
ncbi:hypothetical protein J7J45_03475 [Candidatus Aerophobetes bacterium]|nr:hypothetical protein [Candidatus Aerophobetes bacterium]